MSFSWPSVFSHIFMFTLGFILSMPHEQSSIYPTNCHESSLIILYLTNKSMILSALFVKSHLRLSGIKNTRRIPETNSILLTPYKDALAFFSHSRCSFDGIFITLFPRGNVSREFFFDGMRPGIVISIIQVCRQKTIPFWPGSRRPELRPQP